MIFSQNAYFFQVKFCFEYLMPEQYFAGGLVPGISMDFLVREVLFSSAYSPVSPYIYCSAFSMI